MPSMRRRRDTPDADGPAGRPERPAGLSVKSCAHRSRCASHRKSGIRSPTEDLGLTMTPFDHAKGAAHITVYAKPGCVQCRATIRALKHAGLDFTTVDVTTDTQGRDF